MGSPLLRPLYFKMDIMHSSIDIFGIWWPNIDLTYLNIARGRLSLKAIEQIMAHWTNRILSYWLVLTNNWGMSCWLISFMSFISIVVWPTAGLRFRFDEKTSTTTDRKEFDRFNWSCKFPYLKFLISVVCSHLIESMNTYLWMTTYLKWFVFIL